MVVMAILVSCLVKVVVFMLHSFVLTKFFLDGMAINQLVGSLLAVLGHSAFNGLMFSSIWLGDSSGSLNPITA